MEYVLVLLVVAVVNAAPAQDNLTVLDELFLEKYGVNLRHIVLNDLISYRNFDVYEKYLVVGVSSRKSTPLPLMEENTTCVINQLGKFHRLKLKKAIDVGMKQLSSYCAKKQIPICSAVNPNCTLAYEEQVAEWMSRHVEDLEDLQPGYGRTPLEILRYLVFKSVFRASQPFSTAYRFMTVMSHITSSVPSIEPFTLENLVRPWIHEAVSASLVGNNLTIMSQDKLTWGIVTSNAGTVDLPCSYYNQTYSRGSEMFINIFRQCSGLKNLKLTTDIMGCVYNYSNSKPLTWSTGSSVYLQSQCLCLISNGIDCGVKAHAGVDPKLYCLSVLLRDLQRQVFYRPAVTYLDYAFQTRVSVCRFNNLLQIAFRSVCDDIEDYGSLQFVPSVQCYFQNLVNKQLNCTKTELINTYNRSLLCNAKFFMLFVLCDSVSEDEVIVPYYGAGDSTLVLVLKYVDVSVRAATLFTYLACPQLRNLPGKLLICYQVTALLRPLVVSASLPNLALAVRFDVSLDLATTLWLTAYLHFLTVSIIALCPPDSLRPGDVRSVLFRYALFGWTLPAALSFVFFLVDDAYDSHLKIGQMSFVLCNYVALFSNLFMFFKNYNFYNDVLSSVRPNKQGASARSDFASLFNFAVKTLLLSGAGITLRLVFVILFLMLNKIR